MTHEPRPTPLLWRLEYLRKWHGQPELIRCVKWFESELCATMHGNEISNGKGEFVSLAKYVAVDPAYVLPDPPRSLTPEQVERARAMITRLGKCLPATCASQVAIDQVIDLLREVVGDATETNFQNKDT